MKNDLKEASNLELLCQFIFGEINEDNMAKIPGINLKEAIDYIDPYIFDFSDYESAIEDIDLSDSDNHTEEFDETLNGVNLSYTKVGNSICGFEFNSFVNIKYVGTRQDQLDSVKESLKRLGFSYDVSDMTYYEVKNLVNDFDKIKQEFDKIRSF